METLNFPIDVSGLQSTLHPLLQTIKSSPIIDTLKPSTTADSVAVLLFLLSALGYLTRGRVWDRPDPNYKIYFERPQLVDGESSSKTAATRNIAQCLEDGSYQAVIFWGSQSGTSERFAEILARECLIHFGIRALAADLSDYDAESIAAIRGTHFAIFILSTYGEGDPSDNAAGLWDWIKRVKEENTKLDSLRYLALGLGNSNYKYYNRVLDAVVQVLDAAGATTLVPSRRADDARGATEEDFQSWKDDVFALFRRMGYEEKSVEYQPTVKVELRAAPDPQNDVAHQISVHHQQSSTNSAILPLPVKNARELFTAGDRNCIHMELDLGNNDIVYKTGDHIGIWPCNPDEEVQRLLHALGLEARRSDALEVSPLDGSAKPKVPSLTTLEAALRHHLEICSLVSRKTALDLAQFAPTPEAKTMILEIGEDRERYAQLISTTHVTLARLLQLASPTAPWTSLPLSFVIENVLPLQPRYYSISSSSVISPRRIAITALVVNKALPGKTGSTIQGLTSNYILSASKLPSNASIPTPSFQHTAYDNMESGRVFAHVRKSKFKLPITSSTPLILISAGTGFAPFRAFLAERTKLHAIGKPVGKILLFFGCRSAHSDFIYREELEKMQNSLGDKLEIVTAFSRDGDKKVYVQDRVEEYAGEILEMLDAGANLYVCGKASMAREVDGKIEEAAATVKGLGETEVKAWTDGLKKRGKWKADVWG
ncbi:cytochrome P450 reductase 2 [Trematosphaeria pertusa]|uniref:NADPH--cytochrome P450 reductase n=1 Tax=Trematosphaeria pertusa TaxID=390896 RepID=A0A6A6IYY9_9PLEO|nr:cytochrome P450 reductase 2 [Trematosphaeria pertusa]KAF2255267.1 cytochrome P450 reductase 2 [Trematosphaeria pertusa]